METGYKECEGRTSQEMQVYDLENLHMELERKGRIKINEYNLDNPFAYEKDIWNTDFSGFNDAQILSLLKNVYYKIYKKNTFGKVSVHIKTITELVLNCILAEHEEIRKYALKCLNQFLFFDNKLLLSFLPISSYVSNIALLIPIYGSDTEKTHQSMLDVLYSIIRNSSISEENVSIILDACPLNLLNQFSKNDKMSAFDIYCNIIYNITQYQLDESHQIQIMEHIVDCFTLGISTSYCYNLWSLFQMIRQQSFQEEYFVNNVMIHVISHLDDVDNKVAIPAIESLSKFYKKYQLKEDHPEITEKMLQLCLDLDESVLSFSIRALNNFFRQSESIRNMIIEQNIPSHFIERFDDVSFPTKLNIIFFLISFLEIFPEYSDDLINIGVVNVFNEALLLKNKEIAFMSINQILSWLNSSSSFIEHQNEIEYDSIVDCMNTYSHDESILAICTDILSIMYPE